MKRLALLMLLSVATSCHTGPYSWNPDFTRAPPLLADTTLGVDLAGVSILTGTATRFTAQRALTTRAWAGGEGVLVHLVATEGLTLSLMPDPAIDRYLWLDLASKTVRALEVPNDSELGPLGLATMESGATPVLVAPSSGRFFRVDGTRLTALPAAPLHPARAELVLARRNGSLVFNAEENGAFTLVDFDGASWRTRALGAWHAVSMDDARVRVATAEPGQLCTELRRWPELSPLGSRDCVFTSLFPSLDREAIWHGTPDEIILPLVGSWVSGGWSQAAFFYDGVLHGPLVVPIGNAFPQVWRESIARVPGKLLVWNNWSVRQLPGLWRYEKGQPVEELAPVDPAGRDCTCDRARDVSCGCLQRDFVDHTTLLAHDGATQVVVLLDSLDFEAHLFVKSVDLPRRGHLFLEFDLSCFEASCGVDGTSFCSLNTFAGKPVCRVSPGRGADPGRPLLEQTLIPLEGALEPNDTGLALDLAFAPGSPTDGGPKYPYGALDSGVSDEGTGFVAVNPFDGVVRATLSAPGYEPIWLDVSGTWEPRTQYSLNVEQRRRVFLPKGRYVPGVTAASTRWIVSPATGTTLFEPSTWMSTDVDGGVRFTQTPLPPSFGELPPPVAGVTPNDCRSSDRFLRAAMKPLGFGQTAAEELVVYDFGHQSGQRMPRPTGMVGCFAPSAPIIHWRGSNSAMVWWLDSAGIVQTRTASIPSGLRPTAWSSNDGEVLFFAESLPGPATRLATWRWRNDTWVEHGTVPAHVLASPWQAQPTASLDALLLIGPPLPGSTSTATSLLTWYPLDGSPPLEVPQVVRARATANSDWLLLDVPQGLRRWNPRTLQTVPVGAGWNLLYAPTVEPLPSTNGVLLMHASQGTAVLDLTTGTLTLAANATFAPDLPGVAFADGQFLFLDDPRVVPNTASGLGLTVTANGNAIATSGGTSARSGAFNTLQSGTSKNPWGLFGAPCEPRGSNAGYHLVNYPSEAPTSEGQIFCVP